MKIFWSIGIVIIDITKEYYVRCYADIDTNMEYLVHVDWILF